MTMRERIKAIRTHESVNMTQAEFSVSLGLASTSAASWEKKSNPQIPTESMRILICEKFGVNRNWLESGEGEMFDVEPDPDQAVLNEIAKEYKDNPVLRALLESYVKLSDAQRSAFDNYVMDFMDNYNRARAERERAETLALIQRQVDVGEGLRTEDAI